jgi:hypothetical protein
MEDNKGTSSINGVESSNASVNSAVNVPVAVPVSTVETPVSTSTSTANTTSSVQMQETPKKDSKKMITIILVIIAVLFLCCGGAAAALYAYVTSQPTQILDALQQAQYEVGNSDSNSTDTTDDIDTSTGSESSAELSGTLELTVPDFTKMPGTTICDSVLCSDVWDEVSVFSQVYSLCNDLSLKNTELISKPTEDGTWTERWTMTGCGKDYAFKVDFTSDKISGTNFFVSTEF